MEDDAVSSESLPACSLVSSATSVMSMRVAHIPCHQAWNAAVSSVQDVDEAQTRAEEAMQIYSQAFLLADSTKLAVSRYL